VRIQVLPSYNAGHRPSNRFRPVNSIEAREGGDIVVSFDDNLQTIFMKSAAVSTGPEKDGFTFDRVFPMGTKQEEIFEYGVKEYVFPELS
jgi:kinesin family protein 5